MIDAVLQEATTSPWPASTSTAAAASASPKAPSYAGSAAAGPGARAIARAPASTPEIAAETTPAEPRVIFVDGFNVLHATLDADDRGGAWWTRTQREALLARMTRWPEAGDEIWVVFDGPSPAWSCWAERVVRTDDRTSPTVHCVFVENADDWIVRRARRAAAPGRTIVVSRDHQVAGRARSAGCRVWSPGELLGRCPEAPPDQAEAEERPGAVNDDC